MNLPVRAHRIVRPSRLFKSISGFITHTLVMILRAYTTTPRFALSPRQAKWLSRWVLP